MHTSTPLAGEEERVDEKMGNTPSRPAGIRAMLSPEAIVAPEGYNRWKMVVPAVATHVCLGSIYAWSIMNEPLIREIGVVCSAGDDWSLTSVVPVFSTIAALHGISAAMVAKWQQTAGPRMSGVVAALCFGGGFMVGGAGIMIHSLPLLYLGYGVLGGFGMGFGYVPPVAALINWFPDKRGLATGLTIMGFGGGALLCAPAKVALMNTYQEAPTYLGHHEDVATITENGRRFVDIAGELKEVVVATANDISKLSFDGLSEGVYLTGTGTTGSGAALATIGAAYLTIMLASAWSYRLPAPGYKPVVEVSKEAETKTGAVATKNSTEMVTENDVHIDTILRTPQFWQMWGVFACISTAGMGIVSIAKTLMADIFANQLPLVVTGVFCSSYVMALSAANLGGRLFWSSVSDRVGRKKMFMLFTAGSIPLYIMIPSCVSAVMTDPSLTPLATFYASSLFIFSFFGATYATMPAYEADLFGAKNVGAAHGFMLTASSFGAIAGPNVLTYLRGLSEKDAIDDLVSKISPERFMTEFGAPVTDLPSLIAAKSVTVNQLLNISPAGTADPTPFLYDTTMYSSAALIGVATVLNLMVKPVDKKHHM